MSSKCLVLSISAGFSHSRSCSAPVNPTPWTSIQTLIFFTFLHSSLICVQRSAEFELSWFDSNHRIDCCRWLLSFWLLLFLLLLLFWHLHFVLLHLHSSTSLSSSDHIRSNTLRYCILYNIDLYAHTWAIDWLTTCLLAIIIRPSLSHLISSRHIRLGPSQLLLRLTSYISSIFPHPLSLSLSSHLQLHLTWNTSQQNRRIIIIIIKAARPNCAVFITSSFRPIFHHQWTDQSPFPYSKSFFGWSHRRSLRLPNSSQPANPGRPFWLSPHRMLKLGERKGESTTSRTSPTLFNPSFTWSSDITDYTWFYDLIALRHSILH